MQNIARSIEHTLLHPTISEKEVDGLVAEAKELGFIAVCVPPFWVKRARREIGAADIQLVTVVGFPLGYQMTETKIEETRLALRDGATEIDLVMNISAFKMQHLWFKTEIAKVANMVHEQLGLLKVIIETAYLSAAEIEAAALGAADAGADFVKTSTGFAAKGASLPDVQLLRKVLPSHVGIKAAGGIKTLPQTLDFLQAGADRIGTSSGLAIVAQISEADAL